MTESEWLGFPLAGAESGSVGVTSTPPTEPNYTISEACLEIDALKASCERWSREYTLLAEQLEEVRESRERLRIRVCELEGIQEMQFGELRTANGEIDRLRSELATAKVIGGRGL